MGTGGSRTSVRAKLRQSRAFDTRSLRLTLTHLPSGIVVKGEIPDGRYARKEMSRLKEELRRQRGRFLTLSSLYYSYSCRVATLDALA